MITINEELNKAGLTTEREVLLSIYDSMHFQALDVDSHMDYVLLILGKAEEIGLISIEQRNNALNGILNALLKEHSLHISVYHKKFLFLDYYLYYKFTRNRDRLQALLKEEYNDRSAAVAKLFSDAQDFFGSDLLKYDSLLKSLEVPVKRLSSPFYMGAYNQIVEVLSQFHDSGNPLGFVNLQVLYPLHKEPVISDPMPRETFSYIDHFSLEVSICEKLGIGYIQKELNNFAKNSEIEARKNIKKKQSQLTMKQKKLEQWRKQTLARYEKLQAQYDEAVRQIDEQDRAEFSSLHPNLVGSPLFDEEFETYQLEFPDSHYDVKIPLPPDPIEIERVYKKEFDKLMSEQKALDAEAEKSLYKSWMSDCDITLSFENVVRLRSLILYLSSGEHTASIDQGRFSEMLDSIPYEKAARMVVASIDGLTDSEKQYLIG